jgi:hypothetical protein
LVKIAEKVKKHKMNILKWSGTGETTANSNKKSRADILCPAAVI